MQTRLNTSRPIRDSCVFVASYIIVSVIFYFFPYIGGVLLSVNVEGKQLGSIINAFRSAIIIGAVERKKKIWESMMPFFAFLVRFHKAGRKKLEGNTLKKRIRQLHWENDQFEILDSLTVFAQLFLKKYIFVCF